MPEQTWQPAEGVAIDTYIDEGNPAVNFGANIRLHLEEFAAGRNLDIFMLWDLSSIPKGSTIEIATLYLWAESQVGAGVGPATITRVLPGNAAWTELGCTWNTMDGANAWAGGAGCEVAGTDLAFTHLWEGASLQGAPPVWYTWDLAVSEVQFLIDSYNYGFKFYANNRAPGGWSNILFTSSSGANAAHHPKLYVRWIEPSGRLVEYTFNVWDPLQRIIARDGNEVPPNEVREDKWGKLMGFRSPSSKVFASLAEGPDAWYTNGITSDGETVRIIPDENLFGEMILKRLARG